MKTPKPRLSRRPGQVFVLLAPGFPEPSVVKCLALWREQGMSVSLVGLSAALIVGEHGLRVQSDLTLEEALAAQSPRLVYVPGGEVCLATLAADPRVTMLLRSVLDASGHVAAESERLSLLALPAGSDDHVLTQGDLTAEGFAIQLLTLLAKAPP